MCDTAPRPAISAVSGGYKECRGVSQEIHDMMHKIHKTALDSPMKSRIQGQQALGLFLAFTNLDYFFENT